MRRKLTSAISSEKEGLSRMNRNHIHLAQGVPGDAVISGMRNSAQVLIYINLPLALASGLKFFISANGVVLCEGPISPQFFSRVTGPNKVPLKGWEGEEAAGREAREVLSEEVGEVKDPEVKAGKQTAAPVILEGEKNDGEIKGGEGDALADKLESIELK